jgi:hypothetical protein
MKNEAEQLTQTKLNKLLKARDYPSSQKSKLSKLLKTMDEQKAEKFMTNEAEQFIDNKRH